MKVVLIGFMGSGKSSVAPVLAKRIGMDLVEMDDLIVEKAGKSIDKIFADEGEYAFRELELSVSKNLKNLDNVVISTGGGLIMNINSFENLKNNSIIVQLYASFDTILKRIDPKLPRPLFKDKEAAKYLYEYRLPLYDNFAQIKIVTDDISVEQVVDEIVAKIKI